MRERSVGLWYVFAAGRSSGDAAGIWRPNMDVFETEDAFYVILEIPGVPEDSLEVLQHEDRITVRGVRRMTCEGRTGVFHQSEIVCGSFERVIRLPQSVRHSTVEAELEMGLLTLIIPKVDAASGRKRERIEIEVH